MYIIYIYIYIHFTLVFNFYKYHSLFLPGDCKLYVDFV